MTTRTLTLLALSTLLCLPAAARPAAFPAERWDAAAAAHLLRRAGFGGSPADVAALAALPFDQALARIVDYGALPAGPALALRPDRKDREKIDGHILERIEQKKTQIRTQLQQQLSRVLDEALRPGGPRAGAGAGGARRAQRGYSKAEIDAYIQQQAENQALGELSRQIHQQWLFQLRTWWVDRMVRSQRPLEEKLTLFWHGHFATSFDTVQQALNMKRQNDLLREHACDFGQLLLGVATDPAMLRYLDGNRNTKRRPNENFAREVLELFSLGVGHYSEADIKAAARAFTGWTFVDDEFYYDRRNHDYGRKTFLGRTGHWTGWDIIEIILEQPRTATYISGKLAAYFLGQPAPPALAAELADTLREAKYDLRPMLRTLFASQAFFAKEIVASRVMSPVELAVQLIRQLGLPAESAALVGNVLPKLGQSLFAPPNVKGWPLGRAWINSATLLARYNLLVDLILAGRKLDGNPQAAKLREIYLPAHLRREGKQWTKEVLYALPLLDEVAKASDATSAIELLCTRLLIKPLAPARKAELARQLILPGRGFIPAEQAGRQRVIEVIVLITSTPQYQLN